MSDQAQAAPAAGTGTKGSIGFGKGGDLSFRSSKPQATEPLDNTVVKSEPSNPDRPITDDSGVEVPLAVHEDITGVPYTAKYFEVEGIWNDPDIEMQEEIMTIEEYYKTGVMTGRIRDGKESYESIVKEALHVTGSENAPSPVQIAKVAEWVKFKAGLEEIDNVTKILRK